MPWTALLWIVGVIVATLATIAWIRRYLDRAAARTVRRFGARVDRFKLTRRRWIVDNLLADATIAEAVKEYARANGVSEDVAWARVREYLREIVPYFNILAYYRVGYAISHVLLGFLYKVTVEFERADPFARLPKDSIVIYVMNHRSNADYVLVAYVLAGDVSISYAVGEWARAFPLEYVFKTFGSYFIRRRYREPLYHTVLERYVQLITRNGVTQGIFPEGGLTRDGKLRPAKIGLLDYALGVARDPELRRRMFIVPMAVNYDRVLEDRTLLRELATQSGGERASRLTQLREVTRFVVWNAARLVTRRLKRYGRAAVTIGSPVSVDRWLSDREREGTDVFAFSRSDRLAVIQRFCDGLMERIGNIVPVTPVALACAAIQSLPGEFLSRDAILARMAEMRDVLLELNARVIRADRDIAETFDRAYVMLELRHVLLREGGGYLVRPYGRPLVSYYANSVAHLLGPFAESVSERDALPADQLLV
jgi:glycerol-3-phosphate O-acyltransferase